MALARPFRRFMLRLVARRRLSIMIGLVLALPSAWVEVFMRDPVWWLEGLSLVVGATGIALIWTGLTGLSPDWVEP